jgi:archaellum component FlaC
MVNDLNLDSVEKFLEKVRSANRSRSKNIQLSLEEAQELSTTIAQIMVKYTNSLQKITELNNQSTSIEVRGGGFK